MKTLQSNFYAYIFCAMAVFNSLGYGATQYQATWSSVNQHNVAPEWFMDAKFGIYFHWGAFCTPQYGMEWYPRNMYNKAGNSNEYKHHLATYGDPFGDWQYHNFILGKNNKAGVFTQFAPKLKSAGGKFDPKEWANLFDSAGAKFAGPVAEHHDGFSMWDSKVNEWNSVAKGPKLDLAKLFSTEIRAKGMKFMMSMHHAWNFTGYWVYPPVTQTDPSLKKLYGQLTTAEQELLWIGKLKEIIDGYQPDLIWQDLYLSRISEAKRLEFLSYYYNKSVDWNKDVVVTSKDGFQKGEMRDYERGGPADITTPYWLTDDAINSNSWSYVNGMSYYTKEQLLHSLIDRVSKNGNLLLNISPMADGSIPQAQRDLLLAMGDWLRKFGSSIYGTRVWSIYGQGPTKMGGGSFTKPLAGTGQDVRYTRAKDTSAVYAIFLGWPGNAAKVSLTGFNSSRLKISADTKVYLMGASAGTDVALAFTQDANGLNVTFPSAAPYTAMAYPVRVQLKTPTSSSSSAIVSSSSAVPRAAYSAGLIPGTIQAENYDVGGEGVAYHDADVTNSGNVYRTDGVDVTGDATLGYKVGWTLADEWLEYTVTVNAAGIYDWEASVSASGDAGAFQLLLDGIAIGEPVSVPNTGDWANYETVKGTTPTLSQGTHTLRFAIKGSYFNLDWIKFTEKSSVSHGPIVSHLHSGKSAEYLVYNMNGNLVKEFHNDRGSDLIKATRSHVTKPGLYILKSRIGNFVQRIYIHE